MANLVLTADRQGGRSGHNLSVLRDSIPEESVELIYLDPPFNSNTSNNVLFKGPAGADSVAQIEAFDDTWHWNDSAEAGGERPFTTDIEDVAFLNDVLEGKSELSANDTIRCLVREDQSLTSSGLSKEIKVVKVVEHIVGARQLKLL